jgi:hypothetical protein
LLAHSHRAWIFDPVPDRKLAIVETLFERNAVQRITGFDRIELGTSFRYAWQRRFGNGRWYRRWNGASSRRRALDDRRRTRRGAAGYGGRCAQQR